MSRRRADVALSANGRRLLVAGSGGRGRELRRRLAALAAAIAAAGAVSGCAGSSAPADGVATARSGSAQSGAQLLLLKELWNPSGDCGCTAEARAKERVEDGRVEAPPPDGEVPQP